MSTPNEVENITSYIQELLCSFTVDPLQHKTIIAKDNSGAFNIYWSTEDQLVLKDINDTQNKPTVKVPKNAAKYATKTGNIMLFGSISIHE